MSITQLIFWIQQSEDFLIKFHQLTR